MRLFSPSKPPPPTYKRAVKNIRAAYLSAPDPLKDWGINWYLRANQEASRIAEDSKIPLRAACHLLAVLSPANRWERNVKDAKGIAAALSTGKPYHSVSASTYGRNKRKAWEIVRLARRGEPYEHILKGQKVTAFANNIEFPDRDVAVTIDFHAYSIGVNWRFTTTSVPEINNRIYSLMSRAYSTVAEEFGLKAHQVQAVTWTWWRKKGGV